MKLMMLLLISLHTSTGFAQVSGPSHSSIFELGVGGAQLSGARGLELLFEIKGTVSGSNDSQSLNRYVIAKLDGGVIVGQGFTELPYVDIQLDLFSDQVGSGDFNNNSWTAVAILGVDLKRDITIDNGLTVRMSFLGVRGGIEGQINESTKIFAKGALDFLAISASNRLSDDSLAVGAGGGFKGEIGAEFLGKIRIILGQDLGVTYANPETMSYRRCGLVYNEYYGFYENVCYRETSTIYRHSRWTSNTFLRLMADLHQNFAVFGQIGYSAYIVSDDYNLVPSSSDGQWQFRFGVSAKL